jgi:integrase/recombinase XerD
MLITYRRHNAERCKFTSRSEYRCKCPIWVTGTDGKNRFRREALKLRDWNRAQELVRKWDVEGQQPKRKSAATIKEWSQAFMQDAESPSGRNLTDETLRKYRHLFNQLEAFADEKGIRFVEDIGLDDLTAFRSTWSDGPLSSSKKLERLRSVYRFAVDRGWVETNYALKLKPPKVKDAPTLPFDDDEMDAIFKAAKKSNRFAADSVHAFILTMRYSGLRISDTTMLSRESLVGTRLKLYTAKTGEHVSILLPDFVASALRSVKSTNPKYFFWTGYSKLPAAASLWRKRLADVFKDAKIEGHSHQFRDTFACSLLQAGVSLQDVSVLLAHRSTKITEKHYSPWVKSRQDALDRALASVAVAEPA